MSGLYSRKVVADADLQKVYTGEVMTSTVTSPAFNSRNYKTIEMYLDVTAGSGTSPTLDVTVERQMFDGTWIVMSPTIAFTQATGVTAEYKDNLIATYGTPALLGFNIRFKFTIGGTTPSFTVSFSYIMKS